MTHIGSHRSGRNCEMLQPAAGNGLIDRRALFRSGAMLAGAAGTGLGLSVANASAGTLEDDPWSRVTGDPIPAYQTPSRFESGVVRALSNPKGEPRTYAARTPLHLLNGAITPNGLHF